MSDQATSQVLELIAKSIQNSKTGPGQNGKYKDVEIKREGTQIILPNDMSIDDAINWLNEKKKADETYVAVIHTVDAFPLDGAYAFKRAIDEIYGFSAPVPPSFFKAGTGLISLQVSPTENVQVPWGPIKIPDIDGELAASLDTRNDPPIFLITGKVKQKDAHKLKRLHERTIEIVRESSIYRGKAIRVRYNYQEEGRPFDPLKDAPEFMSLSANSENDFVMEPDIQELLNVTLFRPIENHQTMRKWGIPLKRGILLAGRYGTGKTMTANVTALKGTRSGWTFIYLTDVSYLASCIRLASKYLPAIIFAEDIDRVTDGGRTVALDSILNTIDGVDSKNKDLITVLTTNHLDKIDPAMLRPGRLDAVIDVQAPGPVAAGRLVQIYSRGMLDQDVDLAKIGNMLAGMIPASIREVVERAKIFAVGRSTGDANAICVSQADLEVAGRSVKAQIRLTEGNKSTAPEDARITAAKIVARAITAPLDDDFTKELSGEKVIKTFALLGSQTVPQLD